MIQWKDLYISNLLIDKKLVLINNDTSSWSKNNITWNIANFDNDILSKHIMIEFYQKMFWRKINYRVPTQEEDKWWYDSIIIENWKEEFIDFKGCEVEMKTKEKNNFFIFLREFDEWKIDKKDLMIFKKYKITEDNLETIKKKCKIEWFMNKNKYYNIYYWKFLFLPNELFSKIKTNIIAYRNNFNNLINEWLKKNKKDDLHKLLNREKKNIKNEKYNITPMSCTPDEIKDLDLFKYIYQNKELNWKLVWTFSTNLWDVSLFIKISSPNWFNEVFFDTNSMNWYYRPNEKLSQSIYLEFVFKDKDKISDIPYLNQILS